MSLLKSFILAFIPIATKWLASGTDDDDDDDDDYSCIILLLV